MLLKGSCHCGRVRFQLRSRHPYPYQRCYCSICRKTQGGGGYAINISGDASSLRVTGRPHTRIYHARIKKPGNKRAHASTSERHFCVRCGSALWLFSPEWPELVHPFASAIDSKLPVPPESTHLMLAFKAPWVQVEAMRGDKKYRQWPEEAIAEWHKRLGVEKR
jgi:hypothetical protein